MLPRTIIKVKKFNIDGGRYFKDKIKYATTCKVHYINTTLYKNYLNIIQSPLFEKQNVFKQC